MDNKKKYGMILLLFLGLFSLVLVLDGFYFAIQYMKTTFFMIVILWLVMVASIIIHEGGHLVMGLLTGYKFQSFRIFSLQLSKNEDGFKFSRRKVPGTQGQCLMVPPETKPLPIFWYNFGGVLFNSITALVALILMFVLDVKTLLSIILVFTIVVNLMFAITNWMPSKKTQNDGNNYRAIKDNEVSIEAFYLTLNFNAQLNQDIRMKDLDLKNAMSLPLDFTNDIEVGLATYIQEYFLYCDSKEKALKYSEMMMDKYQNIGSMRYRFNEFGHYFLVLVNKVEDYETYNTESVQLIRKSLKHTSDVRIMDILEEYYKEGTVNQKKYDEFVKLTETGSMLGLLQDQKDLLDSIIFE